MNNKLEEYIEDHISPVDDVLNELYRQTHLETLFSNMVSGPVQGKFLEMISKMLQAECILEIGTFTGYSAICLAKGLKKGGKVHTIEKNDELEEMALHYFEKAGMKEQIIHHIGDAFDIIPEIDEIFDLVFIDAHKPEYIKYYKAVFDKVRSGGYIVADNVLWYGKVIEEIKDNDPDTKGIIAFNNYVQNDPNVENMILPLRDGLMLIKKK